MRIPTDKLRAPILATLTPMLNLMTLILIGIFVAIFLLLRLQIVRPISQLSARAASLAHDLDHGDLLAIKPFWPREIQFLANQFNALVAEVRGNHRRLTELAVRDKLTGLYNRRYFDEMLARIIDQAVRKKLPISLIMIDLDGFKAVNDKHGHALGDRVLADVGAVILDRTRDGDICSRVGGDEFLIIAVDCTLDAAEQLSGRLRAGIAELSWPSDSGPVRVGCSVGTAAYPSDAHDLGTLIEHADRAMSAHTRPRKSAAGAP